MRIHITALICALALASCGQHTGTKRNPEPEMQPAPDTVKLDTIQYPKSLNEMRFEGWTRKEWVNNEYIREVRRSLDAFKRGELDHPDFEEYKEYIQGKFVIGDIVPAIWGGVLIRIVFYDYPNRLYSIGVVSDVDEETGIVSDYACMGLRLDTDEAGFTKEGIEKFLKDYPEHQMW